MYITYIMDTGYNSFSTISNEVNTTSNSITLDSSDNYLVGDVILVDNEFMLIKEVSDQTLTVERGYRNSLNQIHGIGTNVQKLVTDSDMKAVRGYALFRGEKGYSFSVSLGEEGIPTNLQFRFLPSRSLLFRLYKSNCLERKRRINIKINDLVGSNEKLSNDSSLTKVFRLCFPRYVFYRSKYWSVYKSWP